MTAIVMDGLVGGNRGGDQEGAHGTGEGVRGVVSAGEGE